MEYRYFNPNEFVRCTPSCDISQMDNAFMLRLDEARNLAGCAFVLTSAYRTTQYELEKGRSGCGYHTKGRAVDISCTDSFHRKMILDGLIRAGFHGIGISDTFIHVDDRPFVRSAAWLYD